MKQEILDFYAERNIPVRKMINKGTQRGLTAESVIEAAEVVYDEIQNGLQIKPIRIVWRIFEKASFLVTTHTEKKDNTISEINELVKKLDEKTNQIGKKDSTISETNQLVKELNEKATRLVIAQTGKKEIIISETNQAVKEVKTMLEWHMTPWYKKVWRKINGNSRTPQR